MHFEVTGDDGFALRTHFGPGPVPATPDASITVDDDAYRELRGGKLDPQRRLHERQIRVAGDMQLAMQLALAAPLRRLAPIRQRRTSPGGPSCACAAQDLREPTPASPRAALTSDGGRNPARRCSMAASQVVARFQDGRVVKGVHQQLLPHARGLPRADARGRGRGPRPVGAEGALLRARLQRRSDAAASAIASTRRGRSRGAVSRWCSRMAR